MSTHLFRLQSLLLDLLSPSRPTDARFMESLGEEDWALLMQLVRQHRVGPLLHWQARRRALPLPAPVAQQLSQLARSQALRALVMQRELVVVARVLRTAGIPYVALKGAYLAWHAYPEARLRPLRDIDILVPHEHGLRAYQLLLENGLTRHPAKPGDPAATLDTFKHLPPLRSASGQVNVELHTRLFDPHHHPHTAADPASTAQFWQRCTSATVGGEEIAFESPTDLLLHLAVHAVFDHEFNNGPLLLPDLAYLIGTHPIDWPLFWTLAEEGGYTRGCVLALSLAERYWGALPVAWPERDRDARACAGSQWEMAAGLMLQDASRRRFVAFANDLAATPGKAALGRRLLGKLFPSRSGIAADYPVREDSPFAYLWYPVKWWQVATGTLPAYLRAARASGQAGELDHVRQLHEWLARPRT